MECPKCHSTVDDNQTVCPKCHKVLYLECPNCNSPEKSAVCSKCGYTILVKCSKCGKLSPVANDLCPKCGFSLNTSLAYQECETDEFASVIIKFSALRNIRRYLKSQELYAKFFFRIKNLLLAQIKGVDCKFIIYGDLFVINMSKELSLATSSSKAVKLALKIVNVFADLNLKVLEEFGSPLNLNITIVKKSSEKLQKLETYENNVKLLTVKKNHKKYLKGMQIILDQYICDEVNKEYKTDSLYSVEENSRTIMIYEIVLDSYVLPPSSSEEDKTIQVQKKEIKNIPAADEQDIYSFKVFDINAKCRFERVSTDSVLTKLTELEFVKKDKIIAVRTDEKMSINTGRLNNFFISNGFRTINVTCTDKMNYKPWGFFEEIFRDYFGLSFHSRFNDFSEVSSSALKHFKPLFELVESKPEKAMTPEDGRFAYMEHWNKFLSSLNKTVIIAEGFENLDDTSIQTLELYFDRFKYIRPVFVFITPKEVSVHSKMPKLLRTSCYTEFTLTSSTIDSCLETLKSDGTDFIRSFYFEKIKENYAGSALYFDNAVEYLKECGVLLDFENKLIIKNKKSVIVPKDIQSLYKARMKNFSKNQDLSLILAYAFILGPRLDFKTLQALGIKDVEKNAEILSKSGIVDLRNGVIYINNYNLFSSAVAAGLKKEAEMFIAKNILAQLGKGLNEADAFSIMEKLSYYKEAYLILWKNSVFAIKTGDYDAYLKNCLKFLSLSGQIGEDISKEIIEENKKEVYNNILMSLYSYSPSKIYFIENILLMDAINKSDNAKIVKLSNLMLQGALISSNYTDALGLLHNILSRMPNPTLIVDGRINTKFLLLSLVNIEILYNIGDFRTCTDISEEIAGILSPDILDKIKPPGFSTNLFVNHILETFRLAGFAKLFLADEDLDVFFNKIEKALNAELPEKDCILAIKDYLAGKVYSNGNLEEYSAFSKVIFLLLQEFSILKEDYERFAQNIYQAKLLASDLHAKEIELFCDLLIAYSYFKTGVIQKAESIYNDVLEFVEKSAMFNIILIAKYLISKLKFAQNKTEEGLIIINDSFALIQKQNNQSMVLWALFEKLYVTVASEQKLISIDTDTEEQKLAGLKDSLKAILN